MSECSICKESVFLKHDFDFYKDNISHSCQICGEDTSNNHLGYFNGHVCCVTHAKYINTSYFMIPFVKKELGYPYTLDIMKKNIGFGTLECQVCNNRLTNDEIDNIKSSDANFYCDEHKEVKFCYSPEWAKAWFLYKQEIKPNAIAKSDNYKSYHLYYSEDWEKFSKWFLAFRYEERIELKLNGKLIYNYRNDTF